MSLRTVAISGFSWSMGAQVVRITLQMASIVILARLLTPDDFGVFAMALPIMSLASLLQDIGLNQSIVQKQDVKYEQINKLFWINFALTLAIAVLMAATSPLVAKFYGDDRLTALVFAWACWLITGTLTFGQYALLARNMKFQILAKIEAACAVFSFGCVLIAALILRNYWALWVGGISSLLLWTVLTWLASDWRPSRPKRGVPLEGMLGFGLNITFHNFASYASRNLGSILIGRELGGTILGYYDRAYKILLYPLENVAGPMAKVMVPVLSRMQEERDRMRAAFLQASGLLNFICMPAMAVGIGAAHELVTFLLGPTWAPVAPIFFWLGLAGLIQPMINAMSWLFLAEGRSRDLMLVSLSGSIAVALSFFVGIRWGAEGVAASFMAAEFLVRLPCLVYLGGKGSVSRMDLVGSIGPLLVAAGFIIVVTEWLRDSGLASGIWLIVSSVPVAYLIALACLSATSVGRTIIKATFNVVTDGLRAIRPA